ncbi:hypothetical protein BDN72DRAFT_470448 [Pluteus cervinus]|uniref:Uncharacterized protein n=1 Tax=Pluteus cervinus TaxID=181527 RepID=A0ACD3B158_9AGAR|nr:hypothetical protein BDN72DRAFT_470448 [Pluteus cervinus]
MSRRRSSSNAMGPPPDRDPPMGPPPLPASASHPPPDPDQHQHGKPKDSPDVGEKYKKLKRRYIELEEKHKETSTELQRSGERNVKMREERNVLLDRIIELESHSPPSDPATSAVASSSSVQPGTVPLAQPSSSALPRTLLNARAHDDVDPVLTSRHVGPQARKREEEQRREQQEPKNPVTHPF